MPVKMTVALLLMQLSIFFGSGTGGKVLVWPVVFSLWLNLKIILNELVKKGHEVVVLRPSDSVSYEIDNASAIEFETYPASYFRADVEDLFMDSNSKKMAWIDSDFFESLCKDVVFNKELMTKLQNSRFDVILADPFIPYGNLLSEILKIPLIYSLHYFPGSTYEKYSGVLLLPPSYVPAAMSELSDRMTFMETLRNVIYVLCFNFWFQTFNEKCPVLPTTLSETMAKADIWLIRTYWDLEFPHPVLPNFDFVGGLHCRPAKPLREDIEDFVQSSGEHGVVVFSLGSMVGSLTEERANVIAAGLAQIPQKILWRFEGKKPETLGSNTRLYRWIPQNDLLGHPKTRAFITHGGTNGIYEAIYHGIPVVGIPLFGDQNDNIVQLKTKGAAVRLSQCPVQICTLYKKNAMRLSRIHHDQPVKPLDRAVFWIEFVMRNKGAKHLRVAAHDLSWVQYHSLDVLGFLLACVLTVMFILKKCCLFCYQKLTKAGRKKKGE
uniref:UDP-glucuronosyltransferase n=1 Tax=Mus spicilegus TaxID=10103 RepID=A0A8C6MQ97_MUSSI